MTQTITRRAALLALAAAAPFATFADTYPSRPVRIIVPYAPGGAVDVVFTSHGPSGPDGLAMDEAGRLLAANPGLGAMSGC